MLSKEERERLEKIAPWYNNGSDAMQWLYDTLNRLAELPVRGDVLTEEEERLCDGWRVPGPGNMTSERLVAIIDRLAALPMPVVQEPFEPAYSPEADPVFQMSEEEIRKDESERCVAIVDRWIQVSVTYIPDPDTTLRTLRGVRDEIKTGTRIWTQTMCWKMFPDLPKERQERLLDIIEEGTGKREWPQPDSGLVP